jgi:hypothetical protein
MDGHPTGARCGGPDRSSRGVAAGGLARPAAHWAENRGNAMTGPDDVPGLRRSRRRWRLACLLSWATFALGAVGLMAAHWQARTRAEAAVREAEQLRGQLGGAEQRAREAAERARRLLYAQYLALAQRQLEQAGQE